MKIQDNKITIHVMNFMTYSKSHKVIRMKTYKNKLYIRKTFNHEMLRTASQFSCYNIIYETLCVIWYHLYNLKNVKNTHRSVILI